MKEQRDELDDIVGMYGDQFALGQKQGMMQAQNRDYSDIQEQGKKFGIQLGNQYSYYEQFIKVLKQVIATKQFTPTSKLSQNIQEIQIILGQLQTIQELTIDQIKIYRKQLHKKFKIIIAMTGIKNYELNVDSRKIQQEPQNQYDF